VETLDASQLRMLPLLTGRIAERARDDPVAERLRRVARFTWLSGQLLVSRTVPVLRALQGAGITVVLIKGAAVMEHGRLNAGVRPIDDLDVLVPLDQAPPAARVVEGLGLSAHSPLRGPGDPILGLQHSLNFSDERGARLDLHWHLLRCSRHPEADRGFLARARPARLRDLDCLVLSPEDTLLNVIEHGCRWELPPALRWVSDAAQLIRSGPLDWDLVARTSREHRLAVEVGAALDWMAQELGVRVPEEPRATLRRSPATLAQRYRRHRPREPLDGGPVLPGRVGRAIDSWEEHLAGSLRPGGRVGPAMVVRWAQRMWLLHRALAVPARLCFAAVGWPWRLRRLLGAHRRAAHRCPGLPPYEPGTELHFGLGGSGTPYAVAGWDVEEEHGRWTRGGLGRLVLPLAAAPRGSWALEARCTVVLTAYRPAASVEVIVDGRRAAVWRFEHARPEFERVAEVPAPGEGPLEILFRVRDPVVPTEARVKGSDDRQLGLLLSTLRLGPASPGAAAAAR
jgi:hypothetical protein